MRVFHGFDALPHFVRPAVTVGSYDGVHLGHRALIGRLIAEARANGGESIVLTFEPHPRITLGKAEGLRLLTTLDEKTALLEELGVEIDQAMADCLYTGLTTDTGCFRYRNVTPRTHRIAGALLELGARGADINRAMFESKTKGQVEAERLVMDTMEFYWEGKCALIQVPLSIFPQTGVKESDLDGLASLPREIQGVVLGVTLKEKEGGKVKVSLRANPPADASHLCSRFGGGGHQGAAGCSLEMTLEEARQTMERACGEYLKELGLL